MFHFEEYGHFSMLDGDLIFLIQEFMDMKIDLQKKKYFFSHLQIVKDVTKEILRRNLIQTW